MGNYEQLKQAVSNVIKTNGTQAITGQVLQNTLLTIVSTVGDNATFAGVATPTTNPGTPDANVFWLAGQSGTYSNFAGAQVKDEAVIFYNANGTWQKYNTGIPSLERVDNINNRIGNTDYVVCSVANNFANKSISISDYELNTKTRILVNMVSDNTANNATLSIITDGGTIPAKPLFYNGVRASADNSWEAGAVLDIYFDGTNFQATQWAGGATGGNKILEWNTDVATTRKEVKTLERKSGMMISYKYPDSGWINEQYIGTLFTDTEWIKNENWKRVVIFDVDPNEDYPTPLSNGSVYEGYGFYNIQNRRLGVYNGMAVIAYPIEQNTEYTLDSITLGTSYISSLAFAIKDGSSGTGADFYFLLSEDISYKSPNIGLGNLTIGDKGVVSLSKSKYTIKQFVVLNSTYKSSQLYLVIGYRFNTLYNDCKLYNVIISDVTFKNIFIPNDGTIDNYEYIKLNACQLGTEVTKNLFSKDNINEKVGIVYMKGGSLEPSSNYQCAYIPLEFDTYYTVSGYKWIALGGISGANNVCLVCEKDEIIVNLKASDFKAESTWLNTDTFFTKTDNIYQQGIKQEVFTFKTPQATELNVDNIGIVINTLFNSKPIEFVDGLQVEVGTLPTDYVEGGGIVLEKVFGYPLPKTSSGGGGTSGDAVFNYLKNQVMFFFGDSITQGTDGGYVGLVKDKVGLGNAVNYGSSGAATGRLVDIMTGLGIREPSSAKNVDYMMCKAITIQIGTNGGVSGNFEKDIPNISIYDIQSYPYTYNNPDGTITDATLDNAEDYFKKLFPNTFYGNLALCLEWVRWKNPNCRVYLITIPISDRNNHIAVRDALIELGELYSIHVIDAQANSGCSFRNISQWSYDKTHLNVIGNELWASYIARELVTNYYDTEIES